MTSHNYQFKDRIEMWTSSTKNQQKPSRFGKLKTKLMHEIVQYQITIRMNVK